MLRPANKHLLVQLWPLFTAGLLVSGCGGKSDGGSSSTPTFTQVYTDVFTKAGCAGTGCHVAAETEIGKGPDLSTQAKAYAALVGVPLSKYATAGWTYIDTISSACQAQILIKANDATNSWIVGILDSSVKPGGCTPSYSNHATQHIGSASMPDSSAIQELKDWINGGATNN